MATRRTIGERLLFFIRLSRWRDWIFYIIFIFAGFVMRMPDPSAYGAMLALIAVFFCVQSFGFAFNDYCDEAFDRLKPKTRNVISRGLLSKGEAALFCACLLALGLVLAFLFLPITSLVFVALLYGVYIFYSAPHIRLKERAGWGVCAHGFSIPLLFLSAVSVSAPLATPVILFGSMTFFLSLLIDLTQEIRDMHVDKKSGFRTTALILGYHRSVHVLRVVTITALVVFSLTVILYFPLYFLALLASAVFYLRILFTHQRRVDFFVQSSRAGDRGIALFLILSAVMLPWYLGFL